MSDLRHRSSSSASRVRVDHARARELAAAGLVSALSPADAAALAGHLDTCRECRQCALDYALQGERIASLPSIALPRDAWPSFAARLDAEEAAAAERRARRAGSRRVASQAHPLGGRPDRAPGLPAPVPAPAMAPSRRGGTHATPVVASVGVGSMLALVATIALVISGLPALITGPSATPFAVDPSSVAWVTRDSNGRFLLQTAPVNTACPSGPTTCTDFGSRPSTIVALDMEPASVFLSRGGRDAVVVDAGAAGVGSSGGSIYAIELPTPYPTSAGTASRTGAPTVVVDSAAALASAAAVASAVATASADAADIAGVEERVIAPVATIGPVATAAPTEVPLASFVMAGGPVGTIPDAVPLPTAAATRAIAEDVILVGGRAAYSPDGTWFAYSARPADASVGPDVYVWKVGDDRSRAVTKDHAAVFAGWVGDDLLISSPDAAAVGPVIDEAAATTGQAAATKATASPKPKKRVAAASVEPSATPRPRKRATPSPSSDAAAEGAAVATPGAGDAAASGSPAPTPAPGPATVPVSYLLDPATGERTVIDLPGLWLPSVDPTGTRVVGWLGTVRPDPATHSWRPAAGSLVVASWDVVRGAAESTPAASATPKASASPKAPKTPRKTAESNDSATPTPADADVDATQPTPTPAVAAGADVSTPTASPSGTPEGGARTDRAAPHVLGAPEPLGIAALQGRLPATWQVRWDPAGTHLAIWVASASDPDLGALTLVALDPTGEAAPKALLSATPALPGFAVGKSRIAWATPPDGIGSGGRVRVLVWSGTSVGETGTAPIHGLETLVEAD